MLFCDSNPIWGRGPARLAVPLRVWNYQRAFAPSERSQSVWLRARFARRLEPLNSSCSRRGGQVEVRLFAIFGGPWTSSSAASVTRSTRQTEGALAGGWCSTIPILSKVSLLRSP